MRKTIIQFVIIAVSIFMVTSVYAAGAGIGKGSNEVFAQASLSNTKDTPEKGNDSRTENQILYTVGYGRFITDPIQLGISHTGVLNSSEYGSGATSSTQDTTVVIFDGFAKYHFYSKGQTVVPYLGIQAGMTSYSSTSKTSETTYSGMSYGVMGGLKIFLSENFAVNTELNYRRSSATSTTTYPGGSSESKGTQDAITALLGFALYF